MFKKALLAWQDLELGMAIKAPGSAAKFKTGDWRSRVPKMDENKCIKCALCMITCPEFCVFMDKEGFFLPNFDYCKGCGICANECPQGAIAMIVEGE